MPQEVVKLFHSQQAQLKVLYVHLDNSHISPRLKCWVKDQLIPVHHLQKNNAIIQPKQMRQKGQREPVYSSHWTSKSKVKHPNQSSSYSLGEGHWTNTYYMCCMFCGHRFFRGNHSERLGFVIATPQNHIQWIAHEYALEARSIHVLFPLCYLLACPCSSTFNTETPKSSLNEVFHGHIQIYLEQFFGLPGVVPPVTYHDISIHITTNIARAIMHGYLCLGTLVFCGSPCFQRDIAPRNSSASKQLQRAAWAPQSGWMWWNLTKYSSYSSNLIHHARKCNNKNPETKINKAYLQIYIIYIII